MHLNGYQCKPFMACNVIYSLPCEIRLHILYYDYNVDAIGVLSHCMYQHVQIV